MANLISKGGQDSGKGVNAPPPPPLNETLGRVTLGLRVDQGDA